jgi:hypothetical protein
MRTSALARGWPCRPRAPGSTWLMVRANSSSSRSPVCRPRPRYRSVPSWRPCRRRPGAAGTSRSRGRPARHPAASAAADAVARRFLASCRSAAARACAPDRFRRPQNLRISAAPWESLSSCCNHRPQGRSSLAGGVVMEDAVKEADCCRRGVRPRRLDLADPECAGSPGGPDARSPMAA